MSAPRFADFAERDAHYGSEAREGDNCLVGPDSEGWTVACGHYSGAWRTYGRWAPGVAPPEAGVPVTMTEAVRARLKRLEDRVSALESERLVDGSRIAREMTR